MNTPLLMSKAEALELIPLCEADADKILSELKGFVKGDLSISVLLIDNPCGFSIGGELLVNKKVCKKYSLIDLLFLELHNLMLSMLLSEWEGDVS